MSILLTSLMNKHGKSIVIAGIKCVKQFADEAAVFYLVAVFIYRFRSESEQKKQTIPLFPVLTYKVLGHK